MDEAGTAPLNQRDDSGPQGLLVLAVLSLPVGAAAGLIGALFRLSLDQLDRLRLLAIGWTHHWSVGGLLIAVAVGATAAGLAAWMVRRIAPHAVGSGIPHVEAVLRKDLPPAPYRLVPVKFVGGLLAIGSGLALGREGPSVQMGASLGHLVSDLFRRSWPDCRVLMAAGAGAGLATAFNAPIAGAIFVLEELVQRFEHRMAIAALGSSAAAISVARVLTGAAPDFAVAPLEHVSLLGQPLFLVLGAAAGLLAIAYNRLLLRTIDAVESLRQLPVEARAALIGGGVAVVAWFAPNLVGGGSDLTQEALSAGYPAWLPSAFIVLLLIFLLRAVLGAFSYAAATPGGLFAPLLVLGAQAGELFGGLCTVLLPGFAIPVQAFAVVGMAAFFTGVVRAPLTGIVLVIEMTAAFTMLLPMLGACFAAMLVPTLLGDRPIYDALRERLALRRQR
jgi:CIC family chloride channel protein